MAIYMKDQVMQEIYSAEFGLFWIKIDESTDGSSFSKLMMFASYLHLGSFKGVFAFCSALETNDILQLFHHSLNQKIFLG